jgi:two-component system, OmpR family, copper resistance phosphate regulon response regulator CusR
VVAAAHNGPVEDRLAVRPLIGGDALAFHTHTLFRKPPPPDYLSLMRILAIEDDPAVAEVIRQGLEENGFRVDLAVNFSTGLFRAIEGAFTVILLDVMLPGGDGFDLCSRLRREGVRTPVLMLTARSALDDRIAGLDRGADDYLTKPFAVRELVARIRALARRQARLIDDEIAIADLRVNLRTRKLSRAGRAIELTTKEWQLLEFFIRNAGAVVDRPAIAAWVWDENHDPFTNVLEVLIRRLRRKIDDDFAFPLIHTLRGSGYRFGQ